MTKCACAMTSVEALEDWVKTLKPNKSILIVDTGRGWQAVHFGPDSFGHPGPDTYITMQAALEYIEELMVGLRRQPDSVERGEVITDPQRIADELGCR